MLHLIKHAFHCLDHPCPVGVKGLIELMFLSKSQCLLYSSYPNFDGSSFMGDSFPLVTTNKHYLTVKKKGVLVFVILMNTNDFLASTIMHLCHRES